MEVSYLTAFLAGIATFFSPCILPIIPGYLSVITGGDRDKVLRRILFFALGLALVFTTLGALIGWVGSQIIFIRDFLIKALGAVLIIYGLHFVRPLPFGLLAKEFGLRLPRGESSNFGA
ncbi:MAG TPA: cytochrome c biogenesis protein CcdA, partial [Patescibacteria group bacterium]|nr:cytochrome c biogenesis protein CcdA [Patescibacteria group bacterium]